MTSKRQPSGHPLPPSSSRKASSAKEAFGFHSVEFSLEQPNMLYQFKIWNSETDPMFMVVREDSAIIDSLETGHVRDMKFYSDDKNCPTAHHRARIDHMTMDRDGRFRDHWRVALEIVDGGPTAPHNRNN